MANRTVEIYGWAQSATTCTANVWFNGNVVYSGPVQTVATQPEINPPNGFAEGIITFEVPVNLSGTFPMTITFTGGEQAMVQKINANLKKVVDASRNGTYSHAPVSYSQFFHNQFPADADRKGGY